MTNFDILEPAVDPNNRISFLLDWELTLKCNLDCEYCGTGLYGGHDNSTQHPPLDDCIKTLDFMLAYADLYMSHKPKGIRYVILNVYGGESLHHPDIVKILSQVRQKYQPYQDRWHLTVTTTTNAIISNKKLKQIIPYIDEFTVSYHSGNTEKQKQQFKDNLLEIKSAGKRQKCVVLMHATPTFFADSQNMIQWCQDHDIGYLPRQLDHSKDLTQFNYNPNQVVWFDKLYLDKNYNSDQTIQNAQYDQTNQIDLSATGRACCGGRSLCQDTNYKSRNFFVNNKFPDWYCSVNYFFLYVKQVTGEIFVNKDCKMNFEGKVGPIGNLNDTNTILSTVKNQLDANTLPVIQCKKENCLCGLCAPKAKNLTDFKKIMEKYQSTL
jgi:pyruvate-formate lyase-activating enzyme